MNEVLLVGRLTKDPEMSYTRRQRSFAKFTLAINRVGGREAQADFIRVVVTDELAESCNRFLKKGNLAAVRGQIRTGSYKNKQGRTVYTTDIVANQIEYLDRPDPTRPFAHDPVDYDRMSGLRSTGYPEFVGEEDFSQDPSDRGVDVEALEMEMPRDPGFFDDDELPF